LYISAVSTVTIKNSQPTTVAQKKTKTTVVIKNSQPTVVAQQVVVHWNMCVWVGGWNKVWEFWMQLSHWVLLLEKAEELGLPNEAIMAIQTSLQLMSNANHYNTVSRRNALLMQLNPKLKPLFTDADFQQVASFLFGEQFGPLAKERLDAANALKKATFTEKGGFRGFQKSHPQKIYGRGGGYQYHSGQSSKGWQANKANKPKK